MASASSRAASSNDRDRPLEAAFGTYLDRGDRSALVDHLLARSNLPGPRANLELLQRFRDDVERYCIDHRGALWELCWSFLEVPRDTAVTGSPIEFIAMCGAVGFGAIGASDATTERTHFSETMRVLKSVAGDPRWRVREAVAMALQRILESSGGRAVEVLASWIEPRKWLQMRAVAAAVAERPLLDNPFLCARSLELHRQIIREILQFLAEARPASLSQAMRLEAFHKLVQALEYSISVVVAADPDRGFPFLRELALRSRNGTPPPGVANAVLRRIVKGNLKKKRLLRADATTVAELTRILE